MSYTRLSDLAAREGWQSLRTHVQEWHARNHGGWIRKQLPLTPAEIQISFLGLSMRVVQLCKKAQKDPDLSPR